MQTEPVFHGILLLFEVNVYFSRIFGLKLLQLPGSMHPPKILQIPRNFAHRGPHMTKNQKCCRFQGFMHSMIQKSKLLCPELPGLTSFGHQKPEKIARNCRKSLNSISNAVNCKELCQGPSQCRHLKQKRTHYSETWPKRGRNVGGNVGETGSSLESLVAWFGFGIFVGRQRPEARKHFMETR